MVALSVSISTISSPRETEAPSDTSQRTMVPSSIESDSRGITISPMRPAGYNGGAPASSREISDASAGRAKW